jgi:hypothetical protein
MQFPTQEEENMRKGKAKAAIKRELVDNGKTKRYIRRNRKGQFNTSVDVGRSLSADRRSTAKTTVKKGQGDRGDVKKS